MAIGKWISDLTPDTAVPDAAHRVFSVRLEVVRDQLGFALKEPEKDAEYVHQLRVGTRRARAALDIFACCLDEKDFRKARKFLRRLRQAAGNARDWDVFILELNQQIPPKNRRNVAGFDFLLGYAQGQRHAAQRELEESMPDYPFTFDHFLADLLHTVDKAEPEVKTFVELARPTLSDRLRGLDLAAAQDLEDYDNLHQVRIAGKRLRYAMEVFADCFATEFREKYYTMVEEMQEILGAANDSHIAAQRLASLSESISSTMPKLWKRYKAAFEHLRRYHEKRLPVEQQRFTEWWQAWRSSGGESGLRALIEK